MPHPPFQHLATGLAADHLPYIRQHSTDAVLTSAVPRAKLALTDVAGTKTYRVDVTGEVLKDDKLFEKYRYRFDFPGDTKLDMLPVVVDRLLPRGTYKLHVKVADAES